MRIALLSPGDEPIVAGRLNGRRAFLRALEQLPIITESTIVAVDFRGVEYATSSFLSEAVLPLREHLRLRNPPGYVVLANLSEGVREEVEELLRRSDDAILSCSDVAAGQISNVELLGQLETKLRQTFDLVVQKGEATAVELHAESRDSQGIGPTAWNNRLTVLTAKGLLAEIPQGRAKKYRPVLGMA